MELYSEPIKKFEILENVVIRLTRVGVLVIMTVDQKLDGWLKM